MCIRDSTLTADIRLTAALPPLANGAATELLVDGDGHSLNCLLYTSDAADERSSVDLGGRRIIKKKKTAK